MVVSTRQIDKAEYQGDWTQNWWSDLGFEPKITACKAIVFPTTLIPQNY